MRLLGLTSYRRRVAYAVGRCTRVTQSRLAGLWCVGAESRLVLVNTMIRLPGAFTSMAVRPANILGKRSLGFTFFMRTCTIC